MSYRGRPSKGCQLCRSRKVRCDEVKPTCGRCDKSGHECQYRDQSDLLFRNQTAIAAQKAEDGWRKRATKSASAKSSESPKPASDPMGTLTTVAQQLSLDRQPSPDLLDLAYQRFLFDFVIPSAPHEPGMCPDGVLDFLPMYFYAASDSCLRAAIMAVCYANYDGRFKSAEARMLSSECCGKALTQMQAAIKDPVKAKSDETLLTVYLLGIWENLTADTFNGHWLAHKRGAVALLKMRTPEEYHTEMGTRIFNLVYLQMLIGSFTACEEPPEFLEHYADVIHDFEGPLKRPAIRLTRLIYQAVQIWSEWRRHVSMPGGAIKNPTDPMELLITAQKLDAEFQIWERSQLPEDWKYQVLQNNASTHGNYDPKWVQFLLKSEGAPSQVFLYSNIKTTFAWNLNRTARLFLSQAMVEMTHMLTTSPPLFPFSPEEGAILDRTRLDSQISKLAEGICASVLAHFTVLIPTKPESNSATNVCGMRGYFLLWPLSVLAQSLKQNMVVGADVAPRLQWLKTVLLYLQNDLGIAKAGAAVKGIPSDFERRLKFLANDSV